MHRFSIQVKSLLVTLVVILISVSGFATGNIEATTGGGTIPDMVLIPSGSFQMGSNNGNSDETPVHSVSINRFYMSKYEVTFDEYDAFCDDTGRSKPSDSGWGRGSRPVIYVSWNDAVAYCDWLTANNPGTYYLPSEAEWEYACRAGSTTEYYWGDSWDDDYGWYYYNSGSQTHPVGEKLPNAFGLYDMSGNVSEWCQDWYSSSAYSNTGSYTTNPSGNPVYDVSASYRVVRGGCWIDDAANCRSADRGGGSPSSTGRDFGFRVARTY